MSRRRKYAPIERIRRALLVVLALSVVGVLAVYLRRDEAEEIPGLQSNELLEGDDVILAGEGFEYEHTQGERRVFRLQADRIVSSRAGTIRLSQVRIEVQREDGDPYLIRSDEATYQVESSEARLEGNVRLRSGDGVELRTARLDLVRNGTTLESTTPVRFELGDGYRGRADELHYLLNRHRLRLSGQVRIVGGGEVEEGEEPSEGGSLKAKELVVEREERLVRAEGNVELRRGGSILRARRLSLSYAEDERTLQFARASWNVTAEMREDSGNDLGTTVEFSGYQLSVAFVGDDFDRAELESGRGQRASLRSVDDAGLQRRIDGPYLVADFEAGKISVARGYDGVQITETLPFADDFPLRTVCSQWALASFDERGEFDQLVLQNGVDYHEEGLQGEGDRVESRSGTVAFTGEPAVLRTDRGVVRSPRIVWSEPPGRVEALDGVRAEFPDGGRFSLIGRGDPSQPIRLTSRRAQWTEEPAEYRFEGEVRAWQGQSYLLADRLVGDDDGDRLVATGEVKTVLRPNRAAEPAAGERARGPVEVTADSLTYERPERRLTYSGSVRAHDTGRTMRCADMDAWMTADDRFERLVCTGDIVLENPDGGHTLRGDRAIYEPGSGQVEVSGSPVVMTNRDGAELKGPVVIYDMESGAAEVRSLPREIPSP